MGCPVWPGQAYYSVKEPLTGKHKTGKIKGEETALIEQVTVVGGKEPAIKRATIRMRFNRNPVIGELPLSWFAEWGQRVAEWAAVRMYTALHESHTIFSHVLCGPHGQTKSPFCPGSQVTNSLRGTDKRVSCPEN